MTRIGPRRQMADRAGIENLLSRYTELLDGGDFEGLGALFSDGAVRITGGPHSGRHARGPIAAADLYRDIVLLDPQTGGTGTRHLIGNLHIEHGKPDAEARSCFVVFQQTSELPLQPIASGRYIDRLRSSGRRWTFGERHIVCDQVGDLSAHMRGA